jgi:hypothetical protein
MKTPPIVSPEDWVAVDKAYWFEGLATGGL